jgi:hypothetical protein
MNYLLFYQMNHLSLFTVGIISMFSIFSVNQALASTIDNEQLSYQVDSNPYGISYSDWTTRWWQWLLPIPVPENPAVDTTGEHCGVRQNGSVWFLAGTSGGKNVRTCTIPSGVSILIPPLNSACSTAEFPSLKTEQELSECASNFQDQMKQIEFILDGNQFKGDDIPRIKSPLFNVTYPEDNIFGAPPGPTQAMSDGNWVFLKPLPRGEHVITSRGVSLDVTTTATNTFVSDVTYNLKVQ